jgi:transposase InsO family protein
MVIGRLELSRRDHADLSVQTTMIEPVDVLEGLELDVIETTPRLTVDQLRLVQGVHAFREGMRSRSPSTACTKAELIRHAGPWRTVEDVELATLRWVDWYNRQRLHGACGLVPPAEFEAMFYSQPSAAPAA